MIHKFIKQFTQEEIKDIIQVRKDYYLANQDLLETKNKIKLEPSSIGLYLGTATGKTFQPSPALIELIAKKSNNKIFINKNTEWLFLCGRDIFGKGIIKANTQEGLVLVQNQKDENLGYGKIIDDISHKERIVIKNILDKGIYLRQEMSSSRTS
jgi:ribosome biogenesis protein Nip4